MEHYIDSFARDLALAGNREVAQMIEYGRCWVGDVAELTGLLMASVRLADYFVLRFPDKDVIFERDIFDAAFNRVEAVPAKRSCMRIEHIVEY